MEITRKLDKEFIKITESGTLFLLFFFLFLFYFQFIFYLSIFRTLGLELEVIGHNIDHRTEEKEVEDSGTKECHTIVTLHIGLILYT